jgi:hypothetical protein
MVTPTLAKSDNPASQQSRDEQTALRVPSGANPLHLDDDFIKKQTVVAQRRDIDGSTIDSAIEYVKKFIIERRLILFGGTAIDYALRLKGDKIYLDDQRPDFDFLSPRSVDDAYDLAEILFQAGFSGVAAVRGIHVQTMKVRTDFIFVADIGYAPLEMFEKIPTLEYMGMRFVHPDYQRMDVHLSFSFPLSGAPQEVIFNRWRKDLKRFNLLDKYYPITDSGVPSVASGHGTVAGAVAPIYTTTVTLPEKILTGEVAFNGFAAFAILRGQLGNIATIPTLRYVFDGTTFTLDSPEKEITLVSHIAEECIDTPYSHFMPYVDLYPESYKKGDIIIMSTKNRLLSSGWVESAGVKLRVVSTHYLLLWFMFKYHLTGHEIYRDYYRYTMLMIEFAASSTTEFIKGPFAPMVTTLGDYNRDDSYLINMATAVAQTCKKQPPESLHFPQEVVDGSMLQGLPCNYYPAPGKNRPIFDYNAHYLFLRSGQIR